MSGLERHWRGWTGCLALCQHNNGNSFKKPLLSRDETSSIHVTQPSYLAYLAGDWCSKKNYDFCYWKYSTVLLNRPRCAVETKFPLWHNFIVQFIAWCLWRFILLILWISISFHHFTHILSSLFCLVNVLRMFYLKPFDTTSDGLREITIGPIEFLTKESFQMIYGFSYIVLSPVSGP